MRVRRVRVCMFRAFALTCGLIAASPIWAAATAPPKQDPVVQLLWPNGAPHARGTEEGDKPSITVCLPPSKSAKLRPAIVICPGGGYATLAMDHEGDQIAAWLNSLDVAAFILRYRHSGRGYRHPVPLEDAQRAMRLVRHRAKQWRVDPARVGILGFSAGGHLASTVGTHFDSGGGEESEPIDRESCRPDFMILAYPVISFSGPHIHQHSRKMLLGEKPDPKLVKELSNELQVARDTPPAFIMHTAEDTGVLAENSLLFYSALRRAKVPAELHIYERGEHGVGLGKGHPGVSAWPEACATWLRVRGILNNRR